MIDRSSTLSFLYPLSEYATQPDSPGSDKTVESPETRGECLPLVAGLDADLAALQRAESALRTEVQRLRRLIRPDSPSAHLLSDEETLRTGEQAAYLRERLLSLHDHVRRLRLDVQCRRVWGAS